MAQTTSQVYQLEPGTIPERFDNPSNLKGYGSGVNKNLLYLTSNSSYGSRTPQAYDMPVKYLPREQKFSQSIAKCGGADLWRYKGLNTDSKNSFITGHVVRTNTTLHNKLVKHEAINTKR